MVKKEYFSIRTGKIPITKEDNLKILKMSFLRVYEGLETNRYFQEHFGLFCLDGFEKGALGYEKNIQDFIFEKTRRNNLYPISRFLGDYTEEDLFDILEFLHDYCSKGIESYTHTCWEFEHSYECLHCTTFDDKLGQKYFRDKINPILREYNDGYEISENGVILNLSPIGLDNLFEAIIPTDDNENIKIKIESAIFKFRKHKSTLDDRKEAIRELADVLEFLRPKIKKYLVKKDEDALFTIANNFAIRHHDTNQQVDYDRPIWYSWIFYFYLSTLHAVLRIIEKEEKQNS